MMASTIYLQTIINKLYVLIFFLIKFTGAFDTFFPISTVNIFVPKSLDGSTLINQIPIAKFNIVTFNKTTDNFLYNIENFNVNILKINKANGELWIDHLFQKIESPTTSIISAKNVHSLNDDARMSITIEPLKVLSIKDFCLRSSVHLCFWKSVQFTVIEESSELSHKIGDIGPEGYLKLCPDLKLNYKLLNGTNYFIINDNKLFTRTLLDHDTNQPGPMINVQIQCQVQRNKSPVTEIHKKVFRINILDRNDNPPRIQDKTNVTIELDSPHFVKNKTVGKDTVIFRDDDSLAVNSKMVYEILNDTSEIIMPICTGYEVDHMKQRASVINCKLIFSRDGNLKKSPYCVILRAIDKTVTSTYGNNHNHVANATICLVADLSKVYEDRPTALALSTTSENIRLKNKVGENTRKIMVNVDDLGKSNENGFSSKTEKINYPSRITVYRTATNYTRIMQGGNITELMSKPNIKFTLYDPVKAFGITELGGIVYVRNSKFLLDAKEEIYYLTVSWLKQSANVMVRIADNFNNTCTGKISFCSEKHVKQDCIKTCGLGAESDFCQWRPLVEALSPKYATCSPNLSTCPDRVCDPLEEMGHTAHHHICPQDCTTQTFGIVFMNKNNSKKGISSAVGVCSCDEFGKCSCSPPEKEYTRNRTKSKPAKIKLDDLGNNTIILDTSKDNNTTNVYNVSAKKVKTNLVDALAHLQCGPACLALVVGCPLVIIIFIILVITRRKYIKNCKRKYLSGDRIGYRRNGNDTEIINVDFPLVSITSTSEINFKCDINSKWEFPRENLKLDVILGEGEFGKVVRGYATNINGQKGEMTVAVKMLKTGAHSVELLALISEFQLLQEVSHPNVIQLLGVCTQGESPLLILEFAEHGSLRNYLRLSRKLECSGIDVEPVTVKDILSFAWQICKGMTYLTEIKLVHRDLAARNVLLAEGKICKVSDFGLTRDIYEDDAYLKRSKDRVPVKWMAPESLADHVYTTRSDVWAFGVLTWELITLGASPYPGIQPQNLYHLLKTGYRMERPDNCSEQIYSIVRTCWADDPLARPSFKSLAHQWERLLGSNAKYLELDNTVSVSNPVYCIELVSNSNQENNDEMKPIEQPAENLDHLWYPPHMTSRESDVMINPTNLNVVDPIMMGYDFPRSLIESNTIEQKIKYENDITLPKILNKDHTTNKFTSHYLSHDNLMQKCHYAQPIKRGKSYIDMTGENNVICYNLDRNNIDKELSKDITFRFSSLLNLNEKLLSTL